ncbi:MAG: hypothetical protein ACYDG2_07190 [Ruminiclostridium sp.]
MTDFVNNALVNTEKPLKDIILHLIATIDNGDISLIKHDYILIQINIREIIKLSEKADAKIK